MKLTKTKRRSLFLKMIAKLITFADENGIDLICYSFHRTERQQKLLYEYGKSQVLHSKHQDWLAMDLAIVKDGKAIWEWTPEYEMLGDYWEQLGGRWGGRWKTLQDIWHFEWDDKAYAKVHDEEG